MELAIEFQQKETETKLPPKNKEVIIETSHFRRPGYRDDKGIWRWVQTRESVAEKVLTWLPFS